MQWLDTVLRFFREYETWIYILLSLGALIYFRRFVLAWQELRGSVFGLEREAAQVRVNQSATALILLVILAIAEFVIISFIAPMYPQANPLLTPTLNVLATPTETLAPLPTAGPGTPEVDLPTLTPMPTIEVNTDGCIPNQIEITSPQNGTWISGAIPIEGSANAPDFGFYILEFAPLRDSQWQALAAGRSPVVNGTLILNWDTTSLQNTDYVLRLVLEDNKRVQVGSCSVQVRVNNP